ncbi:MAG: hypothetical protein LBF16_05860 [Pseudomonadales bacterium]|nr:hypothetical protein [Pseudomonadales bacterium]
MCTFAEVVACEHGNLHRSGDFQPAALMSLLERCDALRKPARFADALLACECDARGRAGKEGEPYPQRPRLLTALAAAQSVGTAQVTQAAQTAGVPGAEIGKLIHAARECGCWPIAAFDTRAPSPCARHDPPHVP